MTDRLLIDRHRRARNLKTWLESGTSDHFASSDGHTVVVVVHARSPDAAQNAITLHGVRDAVMRAHADARFSSVHVSFVGDVVRDVTTRVKHRNELALLLGGAVIVAIAAAIAKRRISKQAAALSLACVGLACAGTSRLYVEREADFERAPDMTKVRAILGPELETLTVSRLDDIAARTRDLRRQDDVAEVHSLLDYVPSDQEAKLPEIAALAEHVEVARRHGLLKGDNWENFRAFAPRADMKPFGVDDLPSALAAHFSTDASHRGNLILFTRK